MSTTSAPSRAEPRHTGGRRSTGGEIRTDIQGMRAIAVSLVLVFHLWPNRLGGGYVGVDVFFVISGFLITSHLLAHVPKGGRDLATFWARRIQRLLPASLMVLALTLVGTWRLAPDTTWGTSAKDILASATYWVNWRFAAQSVDYLAAQNAPSPVEHFWSLSAEEQFYLVWPVVILLLGLLAARRRWRADRVVTAGLVAVVVASLAYSVRATLVEPASAYFVTSTRMWELGLGGLLAALVARRAFGRDRASEAVPLPGPLRDLLAWAGLAAIGWAALTYTRATPFPGWHAAVPVVGSVAVLAACAGPARWSPGRYLALRPVQWLGDISYSVYLWHWPIIVLVPYALSHPLTLLDKLMVVAASLLLAWATKVLVEDRFRTPRWRTPLRKPFLLGASGMALLVAAALALNAAFGVRQAHDQAALQRALAGSNRCFGAAALSTRAHCPQTTHLPVVPGPAAAPLDRSTAYARSCWNDLPFHGFRRCVYGDPHGTVNVAVVGNSHAGEYLPTIAPIARREHWRVTTFIASRCTVIPLQLVWPSTVEATGCVGWAKRVMAATTSGRFDLVVTASRNDHRAPGRTLATSGAAWQAAYAEYLRQWHSAGVGVLVIHDSPFPGATDSNVPDCIAQHPTNFVSCGGPRAKWVPHDPIVAAAKALNLRGVGTVDLTDHICTRTRCPAAVGGVVTYFDGSHLTATYARTLAPYLSGPLVSAVRRARNGR